MARWVVVWARCWVLRERARVFRLHFSAGRTDGNVGVVVVRLGLARHHNAFWTVGLVGVVGVCVGWFCP